MCNKVHIRAPALFMLLLTVSGCIAAYTAPIVRNDGVTFRVHAPQAESVSIVGSFNRWQRDLDMLSGPDEKGWWSITLALPPGRHEYHFVINGTEWLLDPHAQALIDDGLGGRNGLVVVETRPLL